MEVALLIGTILMIASQAVSWFLVLYRSPPLLLDQVWKISLFYCLWALYNRFLGGNDQELGYISMGLLFLTSVTHKRNYSIWSTLLVLLNYCLAIFIVFSYNAHDLAAVVKMSTTTMALIWAYVFKIYMISNLALWSKVLHGILLLPSDGYRLLPSR